MKKTACLLALVAATALLTACHRGNDISFDGRSVTLHADNAPAATITSRGSFSVGPKLVEISPDQRQLLIRYYNGVVAIHQDTGNVAMDIAGKAVEKAGHSIGDALDIASSSSTAGKASQGDEKQMQQSIAGFCARIEQVEQLQATLATRIDAFKPYAGIDPAPNVHCTGSSS